MLKNSLKPNWILCPCCGEYVRVGEQCSMCKATTTVITKIPLGKGDLKKEYKVFPRAYRGVSQ